MKKFHKKGLVLLAAITLLLTCTVSGTVAFLAAGTSSVTNTFTPVELDTKIIENDDFKSTKTKKSIQVQNNGNIDAYVRVAIYGNWVDATGKIVAPWSGLTTYRTAKWTASGGWYYYKGALAPGANTENLLADNATITETGKPEAADHLEIVVVHQSIQAQPDAAVQNAWGAGALSLVKQ